MTDPRQHAVSAYAALCVAVARALDAVGDRAPPPLLPVRRAMQALVCLPPDARGTKLALLGDPEGRDELPTRLAFAGVLAAEMAMCAGLSRAMARDVGAAAALASVGRVLHMGSAHAAPDALAATRAFEGGARALLMSSGLGRHAALRVIAAAGQSSAEQRRSGHPVARLVAVANAYERLTNPPPIGSGYTSVRALGRLLERQDLDPAFVSLLADTIGVFAPGSLVRLDTGETAIVSDAPPSPDRRATPPVVMVLDVAGDPTPPTVIDLQETRTSITAVLDPSGISAVRWLLRA